MPASVIWVIRPQAAATLPASSGRAVHAALLAHVAAADPALAANLHAPDAPRPFTCSSLLGARPIGKGQVAVSSESSYRLRLTALTDELQSLLCQPPKSINLDGHPFSVVSVLLNPVEDSWASVSTWESLSASWLLQRQEVPERIELDFASPTVFHSGGITVPLPIPGLVFGSLLERWNAFAPLALHPALKRYAAECVGIERYSLHTRALPFKEGGLRIGFVGRCAYRLLRRDPFWMSQMQLLADACLYLGVGYQTAIGLGQARRALPLGSTPQASR